MTTEEKLRVTFEAYIEKQGCSPDDPNKKLWFLFFITGVETGSKMMLEVYNAKHK